jgi:HAD superfamily hydrolase (TIGR01509 family)
MIDDILFDLGKVLVPFHWEIALNRLLPYLPPNLAEMLNDDQEAFKSLFLEPLEKLETGEFEFDRFHRIMSDILEIRLAEEEFHFILCDIFNPDYQMISLGEALSKRYGTWLVSNTSRVHYEWILERFPRVAFYKSAALSYELGVKKPSVGYYQKAIRKFKIDPKRSVFIDDLEENIEGAIQAGMYGIVFRDRNTLAGELKRLGVEISRLGTDRI